MVQSPLVFWAVDVGRFALVPAVLLMLSVRAGEITFADLGFRSTSSYEHGRRDLVILLLAMPIVMPFLFAFMRAFGSMAIPGSQPFAPPPYPAQLQNAGDLWPMAVIYLSVTAGIVEEVVFRGAIFNLLPRRHAEGALLRRRVGVAVRTCALVARGRPR